MNSLSENLRKPRDPNLIAVKLLQNRTVYSKDVHDEVKLIASQLDFRRTMVVEFSHAQAGDGFATEQTLRHHPESIIDGRGLKYVIDHHGKTEKSLLGLVGLPHLEPLVTMALDRFHIDRGSDPFAGYDRDGQRYGVVEANLFKINAHSWIVPIVRKLELDADCLNAILDRCLRRAQVILSECSTPPSILSSENQRDLRALVLNCSLLASCGARLSVDRWLPLLEQLDIGQASNVDSGAGADAQRSLAYLIAAEWLYPNEEHAAIKFAAIRGLIEEGWPKDLLLHVASLRLDVPFVREVLKLGSSPFHLDRKGRTPQQAVQAIIIDPAALFDRSSYDGTIRLLCSAEASARAKEALREISSARCATGLGS